jgi:methylglutaconyl-CoA hydratase
VFGFTEAKLGILPAVIAPFSIAKIGLSAARELFLTGRGSPRPARGRSGWCTPSHRRRDLDTAVDACVKELLTSAPRAMAAAKQLIARVAGRSPQDVAALTAEVIARHRVSAEGQAGMRAFLEKRRAPWAGGE